jgi:hypothetical protein
MGIEINVTKGVSLAGIKGKFYDGPLDNIIRKFGEELQKDKP